MRRVLIPVFVAVLYLVIAWGSYEAAEPSETRFSKFVPAGPVLYLESKDFSSLLADWNSSPQKQRWVASNNYETFSRSRLFLRLRGASDQFATAAGLPPDMNFLSQVAGEHTAMALYDIGKLQFLYITYLPSAKAMQTSLWQMRGKFEPRTAGGAQFYLRRDPGSEREVAFAVSGNYLLLATREDLIAGALQLMSAGKDLTVEDEKWWAQSTASTGAAGDLRMVLNLEKLAPNGYFRTYWVQQNITDLSQYSAAVADLFLSSKQYREERVLLRKSQRQTTPSGEGLSAAADLVRLVPENAGLYEVVANPTPDSCLALLQTKLLAPHLGPSAPSQTAPTVQLTSGETGEGADLDTRIDQAPVERAAAEPLGMGLKKLLATATILASLQVQSTERDRAGVFVRIHSAVVLVATKPWTESTLQFALSDFVKPNLTASHLGVGWQQKSGYQELDGLWPLAFSTRDKYLIVADDPNFLQDLLAHFGSTLPAHSKPAEFIAGFNHRHEAENFLRLTGFVDRPNTENDDSNAPDRQPQFFSENIGSFNFVFNDVSTENITIHGDEDKVWQTVTYESR